MNAVGIDISEQKGTAVILRLGGKFVANPFNVIDLSFCYYYILFLLLIQVNSSKIPLFIL